MGTDFWIEITSDKPLEKHLDMKPEAPHFSASKQ